MPKAVQGKQYKVAKGDTLYDLAAEAYGQPRKWPTIWQANSQVLRSGDPNLIFPGEVIYIPFDKEEEARKRELREQDIKGRVVSDFAVFIGGKEVIGIESGKFSLAINRAAAQWVARVAWDPDNAEQAELFKPYSYAPASVYLGGKHVHDGILYDLEPELTEDSRAMVLKGWSGTADMIDSNIPARYYEQRKITLEDRARQLLEPHGYRVIFELEEDEAFKKVTAKQSDTVFNHLSGLARQRGGLITVTKDGDVLITKAADTAPVCTLTEDTAPLDGIKVRYSGRKRYNVYKAISRTPGRKKRSRKESKYAVAKDEEVPRSRFKTFNADDSSIGNLQEAADWQRNKQIAEAYAISLDVSSWYKPGGGLWTPNEVITVYSKTALLPAGVNLLVQGVEFELGTKGAIARLDVIPPEAYGGRTL